MTNLTVKDIRGAISSIDDDRVIDRLNALVLQLRLGTHDLPTEAASELMDKLSTIKHSLGKVAAWEALEFSPVSAELWKTGIEWLNVPTNPGRAQALSTLLSVFPDKRDALIESYGKETDQFVRYAIARSLLADRPSEAWRRLVQLVRSEPNLSLELNELIPEDLAASSLPSDLSFIQQQASLPQKTMVWAAAESIILNRLKD